MTLSSEILRSATDLQNRTYRLQMNCEVIEVLNKTALLKIIIILCII